MFLLRRVAVSCSPQRVTGIWRRAALKSTSAIPVADSPFGDLVKIDNFKRTPISGYECIDELENAEDAVQKIFDLDFASRKEKCKHEMANIIDKYKLKEGDTGSAEVQVATLTLRVKLLSEHLQLHRKDKSCLRRLIQLVQRRRRLMLVLKEFKPNSYHHLLSTLKLKPPAVTSYQYKNRQVKAKGKGRSKTKYVKQDWRVVYDA